MTVKTVCDTLEAFAPLQFQESYDNAGLVLGHPDQAVTGILICLDVTEAVLDEAIALNCNLIVSHHPLIFRSLKKLVGEGRVEACLIKAIKNDIALYAGHTNVDAVINGVNGQIADRLGLINRSILQPAGTTDQHGVFGLGMVGDLITPEAPLAFLKRVKTLFECKVLRYSQPSKALVTRIAVCGGAGNEFIEQARMAGADVLLTGEARYHDFFTEGLGILLVDAGHFETEQFTKVLFLDLLSKKIPTFAVHISTAERNPVNYL